MAGKEFRVSCYVLLRNKAGQVLLLQRPSNPAKVFPGKWELPGGKGAPGEPASGTAVREALEETGLHVSLERLGGAVEFGIPGKAFRGVMLVFEGTAASDEVVLDEEHQAFAWVDPGELLKRDLTDPLRRFVESRFGRQKRQGR